MKKYKAIFDEDERHFYCNGKTVKIHKNASGVSCELAELYPQFFIECVEHIVEDNKKDLKKDIIEELVEEIKEEVEEAKEEVKEEMRTAMKEKVKEESSKGV